MAIAMQTRAKTPLTTEVGYTSEAEYHNKANHIKGRTRSWKILELQEKERKAQHNYNEQVHLADAAALDEDKALLSYIQSGIQLMVKGERVAQDYMKLKYVKNQTSMLKEKYQHQLGEQELPGMSAGDSNLTFPGLDEGLTLIAGVQN